MNDSSNVRLHRVNSLPPVLLGLSSDELYTTIALVFISTLSATTAVFAPFGIWWMGIIITPLASVVGVFYAASFLNSVKLGKPEHYYKIYLIKMFDKFIGNDVWSYAGPWVVVRRNRYMSGE